MQEISHYLAPYWRRLPAWLRYLLELGFYTALFYTLQTVGLQFADNHINVTISPVRPVSGVTVAIILFRGYRFWPAMMITGFVSQYQNSHNWLETLLVPTGGTALALLSVWLIERFVGRRVDFGSIRSVLGFLWWGALIRSILVTTWIVGCLQFLGQLGPNEFALAWTTNVVGTAMGVAVFGSFVLSWLQPVSARDSEASIPETIILFALLGLATVMDYLSELPLTFLPFPLLVWGGLRLGPRALTTAVMMVVVVALTFVLNGYKAFGLADGDPAALMVILQVFIVCVAGTGLVLGALAAQRRRTLRATAELSSFQKAVLDGSNFSVLVTDDHGLITSVNRGAERLLGYSEKELLGRRAESLHDPLEIAARARAISEETAQPVTGFEAVVHLPRHGQADEREWTYLRKDGRRIPVFLSVTRLNSVDGRSVGFLGTAVDITTRKQAEVQMQAAKTAAEQANRAKSEFLANISHEIRTPMNSILGFAELLQRHLRDTAMKKQAQAIFSSGQTLLQLINDLLDLSKVEAGRLELQPAPVDVHALSTEMGQFFSLKAEEKGLVVSTRLQGPLHGRFYLDEVRVRQVLFNLIGNAIKFTESGSVVLTVTAEEEPSGLRCLHFEVADTGIGIPSEQLERLFLPFEQRSGQNTRKYGGTGLGLSISCRLAELMGGTLLGCSEVGVGSSFCLTIPHVRHDIGLELLGEGAESRTAASRDVEPALTPPSVAPASRPASAAAWRACAELADGAWMTTWKGLLQAPLFEEVEQFALALVDAAGEDTPEFLREYGRRLAEQARDFEVEEMMQALREFPRLAERLQRGPAAADAAQPLDVGL